MKPASVAYTPDLRIGTVAANYLFISVLSFLSRQIDLPMLYDSRPQWQAQKEQPRLTNCHIRQIPYEEAGAELNALTTSNFPEQPHSPRWSREECQLCCLP